ncbi:hypothetical protein HF086_015638 [Spodoptera exigua]|uniref:Uncharacterized protein n=1 Tax=Spodoptera exigua TaxID=7107 RepID=A0A922SMU1_SPOEX|nr:hypothetical protein HF086_015638 [Spodoptera exigua]
MEMVLGFLFRDHCQHMDDFKPALIKHVSGKTSAPSANTGWRTSQFNNWVTKETLTLSLICMNSGIVMQALQSARCIALASGTLTPLISLHSELETTWQDTGVWHELNQLKNVFCERRSDRDHEETMNSTEPGGRAMRASPLGLGRRTAGGLQLGNNHHTYESLATSPNGLTAFMQKMKIVEEEESLKS